MVVPGFARRRHGLVWQAVLQQQLAVGGGLDREEDQVGGALADPPPVQVVHLVLRKPRALQGLDVRGEPKRLVVGRAATPQQGRGEDG
jgi:hypothetical protein